MINQPNPNTPPSEITINEIRAAATRLKNIAHITPALKSSAINKILSSNERHQPIRAFFKCEQFQRIGVFKFRGAFNALSLLTETEKNRGVITFSSGNHAQAVALAGRILRIKTIIVMPDKAPKVKHAATKDYIDETLGSEIILYNPAETTREILGAKLAAERQLTLIPPYDNPNVIAGQGTVALELINQLQIEYHNTIPDYLFVPLGGGGLLSGTSIVIKALYPKCTIVGVEPEAGNDAFLSFRDRTLHSVQNPDTIADGARTPSLGRWTFPIICNNVDTIITVADNELSAAMQLIMSRMKIIVEPTAVLGIAGLLRATLNPETLIPNKTITGKKLDFKYNNPSTPINVGIILTGGNLDLNQIPNLLHPSEKWPRPLVIPAQRRRALRST